MCIVKYGPCKLVVYILRTCIYMYMNIVRPQYRTSKYNIYIYNTYVRVYSLDDIAHRRLKVKLWRISRLRVWRMMSRPLSETSYRKIPVSRCALIVIITQLLRPGICVEKIWAVHSLCGWVTQNISGVCQACDVYNHTHSPTHFKAPLLVWPVIIVLYEQPMYMYVYMWFIHTHVLFVDV